MNEIVTKKFIVEAPDGGKVRVNYTEKWSFSPELKHRVDHFELEGRSASSTGYRSDFQVVPLDFAPTEEELIEHVKEVIEESTGLKYGRPVQTALLF